MLMPAERSQGSFTASGTSVRTLGNRPQRGRNYGEDEVLTTTNAVAKQNHPSHHITEIKDPGRDGNLLSTYNTPTLQPPPIPTRCLTVRHPPRRVALCAHVANVYTDKEKDFGDGPKIHKIRITLTSRNVKSLEKVCEELIGRAKTKDLRVKGPVRLPTKHLKVTTRKTPCGEGSKTWDTYEMRIHKRKRMRRNVKGRA
jgi:small subunit ribosomal protein S20e